MRKLYGLVIAAFVVSSFAFIGCTKHPNEEQKQALEEQKQATVAAEQTLEDRQREKSRL